MSQRYFAHDRIDSDQVVLRDAEAHHLLHVMRAAVGQQVVLFDGSGAEFTASITRIGRREVELHIDERHEINREADVHLTLAVALPKGDRQRWLVEKAVELGVARIVPLTTQRGVAAVSSGGLKRLRRAVIEASKQCGRNRLMEIKEPAEWGEFLAAALPDAVHLFAHPLGGSAKHFDRQAGEKPHVIAIGPEGGFTDDEVRAARDAGWAAVSLGRRILRVETAALAVAARVLGSQ